MKLLKIESNQGFFLADDRRYVAIDKISKGSLLRLVDECLGSDDIEFDDYDEAAIAHQAHRVIYKSVVRKLQDLFARRKEFVDESARLYLEDYEKYKKDVTPQE